MIRINKLLRLAKVGNKVPVRGGPGWDRPDVPPTQMVETDRRWTHNEIVYTFFDSSMPEFFITEPEIYEGTLYEALPQLGSIWGVFLGTAFSIYLFNELVNPQRAHMIIEPTSTKYFLEQTRRFNEQKLGLKWAKENPFGITVNNEQFPYENRGKFWYPKRYYVLKGALQQVELINKQAADYLKGAMQRASKPQTNPQAHH